MKPEQAWPAAIVAVLALTVTANIVLLQQAGGPGAASIEPDYYRRALTWDSAMAVARSDRATGWRVESRLGAVGAAGAPLELTVRDSLGAPLADARVVVSARHNSTTRISASDSLRTGPDGIARGHLPLGRRGLWELTIQVRHGGRTSHAVQVRDTDAGQLPR
jgi:hypothetical protein